MSEGDVQRIPTGVADFDSIMQGGLPAGSVVLLLGDVGGGGHEFALTSAAKIGIVKEFPDTRTFMLGDAGKHGVLPEKMCYITFSRSRNDILQDVKLSFNRDFYESLKTNLLFKDFSRNYFMHTVVPTAWLDSDQSGDLFSDKKQDGLLESLVDFLDGNAPKSMVIMDSLTDLVVSETIDFQDVIALLKGIQRMAKKWDAIFYLILTDEILDRKRQQMIIDSVDGVFKFEWAKFHHTSKRQRYLYVEKFMSVLPHLDQERIARFATLITSQSGFVVINTERVG
ncbi:MAG: recombinase RecA [Thermoplasmatota archaeon]|nr:recombinase RecA [Candidatus Thermoplasmatota archaeon]MBU1914885.1 recombinase RecA [Candidatus Thermoplasmatota archaeon]